VQPSPEIFASTGVKDDGFNDKEGEPTPGIKRGGVEAELFSELEKGGCGKN